MSMFMLALGGGIPHSPAMLPNTFAPLPPGKLFHHVGARFRRIGSDLSHPVAKPLLLVRIARLKIALFWTVALSTCSMITPRRRRS